MFSKILIANRGEIALRIHRACKEMGISTVAVHSEADRGAMWVRLADESVCIGPAQAAKSYLNIPSIIAAAEITGAQAVHPGYGFLSENARFAEIVEAHGMSFIGPRPEHIRIMGDKITAKQTAKDAGIPVVPGSDGEVETVEAAVEAAKSIGFPLIVKAAAGGGGRGMKVAMTADDLVEAVQTAQSEAKAAFGNGAVYMERYLQKPRHIEIQVIADSHGNVVHLGERDCSLQRRHQKVVEIAPAQHITQEQRERICADAVRFCKEINYSGAGTVEFLVDENGNHVFIEMNPRIQVEHTVTEEVTDVDLVSAQLRIAAGATLDDLGLNQESVQLTGVALQCRITTEDPANGFRPDSGLITGYRSPGGAGVRLDGSVAVGTEITPNFDSLLVKMTCRGKDFQIAVDRSLRALNAAELTSLYKAVEM